MTFDTKLNSRDDQQSSLGEEDWQHSQSGDAGTVVIGGWVDLLLCVQSDAVAEASRGTESCNHVADHAVHSLFAC